MSFGTRDRGGRPTRRRPGLLALTHLRVGGKWRGLRIPAGTAEDPSPQECKPLAARAAGSCSPGTRPAGRMVCVPAYVCVRKDRAPKLRGFPLCGNPCVSLHPFWGSGDSSLVGCWGFPPCLLQLRRGPPTPCPPPPAPGLTLGGRPAPLRVAPLTSRRVGGPGVGAGPAPGSAAAAAGPRSLRARRLLWGDPGPGRPLPPRPPGSAPGPARAPAPRRGPQGSPRCLSLLPGSLSLCLSACPSARLKVSGSHSIPQPQASERGPGPLRSLRA